MDGLKWNAPKLLGQKSFFWSTQKKWEHYWVPNNKGTELIAITDFLYLVCASHSFSFVCSTIFFFCVSVRCVYICCFSSLNQHWINICLRFHVATLCVYMSVFLTLIHKTIFFFLLHLNSMHTRVCGVYVEICLHIVSLSIFR